MSPRDPIPVHSIGDAPPEAPPSAAADVALRNESDGGTAMVGLALTLTAFVLGVWAGIVIGVLYVAPFFAA